MTALWLVRYSEIFLKSDPVRRQWEYLLASNIQNVLPNCRVKSERGRLWLSGDVDPTHLEKVFGIVSFSAVDKIPLEELNAGLLEFCKRHGLKDAKTFAIRMKRVGKHDFTSSEKAAELGDLVRNAFPHLKVNLTAPDKEVFVEIRDEDCYLYDTVTSGPGGLPLGSGGTLVALVSGGIDSPVAAYMMMKRGCRIIPLYVALDEFLDQSNLARTEQVVESLRPYQPDIRLQVVRDSYLASAKKELVRSKLEKYTCLLCKRRMYRIAESFARSVGAKGIVTGESIGQVASQTLDNLMVLTDVATIPVYRPLIGFDKAETIRLAKEIGTYIPSTVRASGCGAVPKKPSTRAHLEKIREIEERLVASSIPIPEITEDSSP
ncbi:MULTISPECIES: tRNA uracil 4-sulfurtransferase ThiI [unclassified Methanoculleus]|jgi:thiamine biosynthesis protein ThiI|uniref:tRNA uracil 4-sulfurtransferase ThiI n=1 Tax=unclassified Methanoculleus TaxID=2619537 RepID=UPI0025CB905F|nr:tRNA uracil 4-sulfurtransferase ThiI [Methanoculleus sp. UBA377]